MTDVIKSQILEIRDTGLTNMFDTHMVEKIALGMGFTELIEYIKSDSEQYFNFVLHGDTE